jgi:hypothetical protein
MPRFSGNPTAEEEVATPTVASSSQLDFAEFPPISTPRNVYFTALESYDRDHLRQRGYAPFVLMELPRATDEDHKAYLLALAQGMADGTIIATTARLNACELEMKARKMLLQKEVVVGKTKKTRSTEELLASFGKSHHGFTSTTMQVEDLLGVPDATKAK